MTLNVVICEPLFFKKHDDAPKGIWKKKLVWKEDWVKDFKTEKQEIWKTEHKKIKVPVWQKTEVSNGSKKCKFHFDEATEIFRRFQYGVK